MLFTKICNYKHCSYLWYDKLLVNQKYNHLKINLFCLPVKAHISRISIIHMSFNKTLSIRRKEKDIFKLKNANVKVAQGDKQSSYLIEFKGPKQTPYEKGKWTVNLYLPEEYPYKSPSVGFMNKIFHPNIDYASGSVCLDVINQTWTPMYQLVNIFQIFLPQLLTYPNPASPLNHQAATLFEQNTIQYNRKVLECIQKFAFNEQFRQKQQQKIQTLNQQSKAIDEQQGSLQSSSSCSLSERDSINQHQDLKLY